MHKCLKCSASDLPGQSLRRSITASSQLMEYNMSGVAFDLISGLKKSVGFFSMFGMYAQACASAKRRLFKKAANPHRAPSPWPIEILSVPSSGSGGLNSSYASTTRFSVNIILSSFVTFSQKSSVLIFSNASGLKSPLASICSQRLRPVSSLKNLFSSAQTPSHFK